MELLLLLIAPLGLLAPVRGVHLLLLAVHVLVALWIAWRVLRRQPLTTLFILVYVGMYFPNPLALMLDWVPVEPGTTDAILYRANVLVMVGLDLFILAALRLRFTHFDIRRMGPVRIDPNRAEMCIVLTLLCCGVAVAGVVVALAAMGVNAFTVAKTYRSVGGRHTPIYLVAKYCLFALPLGVFLIGLRRRSVQLLYLFPVLALLATHFLIYRTRTLLVATILAWVVALIARNALVTVGPRALAKRVPLALRIAVIGTVPLLGLAGVSLRFLRYAQTVHDYSLEPKRIAYIMGSTFAGGDFGYALFLRTAMANFPDVKPYLMGQSYYRVLFALIPRHLWSGKPPNTQRIFAGVLDPASAYTGRTIPPGIVGDLYINFGYAGVFGMLVFGMFFGRERYRHLGDLLFLAGSGTWLVHLARGAFTNPVMTLLFLWVLCRALDRMIAPDRVIVPAPSGRGRTDVTRRGVAVSARGDAAVCNIGTAGAVRGRSM